MNEIRFTSLSGTSTCTTDSPSRHLWTRWMTMWTMLVKKLGGIYVPSNTESYRRVPEVYPKPRV
jgi:hypothetical protein